VSLAGQNTFSGISAQADVALYYLLEGYKNDQFVEIIVEDKKWEDFTLVYQDHIEVFEVKWYQRNITHSIIHNILKKKRFTSLKEKDKLTIVGRTFSPTFQNDFQYVSKYGFWWRNYPDYKKYLKKDPIYRRLKRGGWSYEEIDLLKSVCIVEFKTQTLLLAKIEEFFVLDYPVYLDRQDQKSVIALTFQRIMEEGSHGGRITKLEFVQTLNDFINHIADSPTFFRPTLTLGRKIINLNRFLRSERKLQDLNQKTFLTQISSSSRLIYYLYNKLLASNFEVHSFDFFLQNVLIKHHYSFLAMHLLETRWKQRTIKPQYLLTTILNIFEKLKGHLERDSALKLLEEVVNEDTDPTRNNQISTFLQKYYLVPFSSKKIPMIDWSQEQHEISRVANILIIIYERTKKGKSIIDFVFNYFDMTGDYFPLVQETPSSIYSATLEFMMLMPAVNLEYVVEKLSEQFNKRYGGKYRGYEWSGPSHSQTGGRFSISDIGAARKLFRPLFEQLYKVDPKTAWTFIKKRVLLNNPHSAGTETPVFLKRAVIPLLIRRVSDNQIEQLERNQSLKFLRNILSIRKGWPSTSDILFSELRDMDLAAFGYENIMQLVELDSKKTTRCPEPGYPSNIFVIITLLRLAKVGYDPAKKFMVDLVRKHDYLQYDRQYRTINLLSYESVVEFEPDFVVDLLEALDIESYLEMENSKKTHFFLRSDFLEGLFKKDWLSDSGRSKRIIHQLLKKDNPSARVLEFVTGPIQNLSKENAQKIYEAFEEYLQTKDIFRQKFANSVNAREHFVWLAKELANKGCYDEAKKLINFCIDDPDPNTDDRESSTNHHFAVMAGEDTNTITSVRGSVGWALMEFASAKTPDPIAYALEGTELLLDLDGRLHTRLGYSEPDYYVRLQSMHALTVLVNLVQRKRLDEYQVGLGNSAKQLAVHLVTKVKNDIIERDIKPSDIANSLINVFDGLRDLSTDEASELLDLFEKLDTHRSCYLFMYFAEFREQEYPEIPFDPHSFKERLHRIINKRPSFARMVASECCNIVDNDNTTRESDFSTFEPYWESLFQSQDRELFRLLYKTLEKTLTWPSKYSYHRNLLKNAISNEAAYLRQSSIQKSSWGAPIELLDVILKKSIEDFLDILQHIVNELDETISFFSTSDYVRLFKSFQPSTAEIQIKYNKIEKCLKQLYPEMFEE
jgi:hypothetical protein